MLVMWQTPKFSYLCKFPSGFTAAMEIKDGKLLIVKEPPSLCGLRQRIKDNSNNVISFNLSSCLIFFVRNHRPSIQSRLVQVHEVSMKITGSSQFSQNATPGPCPEQVLISFLLLRSLL